MRVSSPSSSRFSASRRCSGPGGAGRAEASGDARDGGQRRRSGIPIVEGLAAFHRGAYAEAVELLLQVRFELWQIGGSHAQRDVVDWTLTEAPVRAGQRDIALSLAHERLGNGPRVRATPQTGVFFTMPRTSRADRAWCAGRYNDDLLARLPAET